MISYFLLTLPIISLDSLANLVISHSLSDIYYQIRMQIRIESSEKKKLIE
jgi:hypothetical protein